MPKVSPGKSIEGTRAEVRCPDPSSNTYLAFAVMIAAGLDGVEKGLQLSEPVEESLFEMDAATIAAKGIRELPGTLGEAIDGARGRPGGHRGARRARLLALRRGQARRVGRVPDAGQRLGGRSVPRPVLNRAGSGIDPGRDSPAQPHPPRHAVRGRAAGLRAVHRRALDPLARQRGHPRWGRSTRTRKPSRAIVDLVLSIIFLADFLAAALPVATRDATYFIGQQGYLDLLGSLPFPLFRLFRIVRVYRGDPARSGRWVAGGSSGAIIRERAQTALLFATFLCIVIMEVGSILVVDAERGAPNANITTGGDALWWSIVSVTTVGYGDKYPVTTRAAYRLRDAHHSASGLFGVFTGYVARIFLTPRQDDAEQPTRTFAGRPTTSRLPRRRARRRRGQAERERRAAPTSLSSQIRPPWCSTISRQIARPRPVPRGVSDSVSPAWANCSKTRAWSSGAMPVPVSATLTTTPARRRRPSPNRDGPRRRELHRVRQEVDHDLDEAVRVAVDRRQVPARSRAAARGRSSRTGRPWPPSPARRPRRRRPRSWRNSILPASIFSRSRTSLIERGEPVALGGDDLEVVADLADCPLELRVVGAPPRSRGRRRAPAARPRRAACRTIFVKPTTEVSGVRSSWLTFARNWLFVALAASAVARAAWASSVASASWAVRGATRASSSRFWSSISRVQPGVLDGRREEVADGEEQRAHRPLDLPPGEPVVDREDADRPALRLRAACRGTSVTSSARAKARLGSYGIVVDVAEHERPVGQGQLDERRALLVERQTDRRRRAPAPPAPPPMLRPSVEDAGLLVDEQDERPIERQMVDDRGERARRAGSSRSSVELTAAATSLSATSSDSRPWSSARDRLGFLGLAGEALALARCSSRLGGLGRRAPGARPVAPYRTRPAGSSVARTIASASHHGGFASRIARTAIEPPTPTISSTGRIALRIARAAGPDVSAPRRCGSRRPAERAWAMAGPVSEAIAVRTLRSPASYSCGPSVAAPIAPIATPRAPQRRDDQRPPRPRSAGLERGSARDVVDDRRLAAAEAADDALAAGRCG